MDEQEKKYEPSRGVPSAKSRLMNKKDPHKRSTLMNAGMSASRKGLKEKDLSERSDAHSSFRQQEGRDMSPQKNLDHEGSSQLTYPNQHAQQFMPREQAMQVERQMDHNGGFLSQQPHGDGFQQQYHPAQGQSSTQYDGIFFDQRNPGGFQNPTQQPFNNNMMIQPHSDPRMMGPQSYTNYPGQHQNF